MCFFHYFVSTTSPPTPPTNQTLFIVLKLIIGLKYYRHMSIYVFVNLFWLPYIVLMFLFSTVLTNIYIRIVIHISSFFPSIIILYVIFHCTFIQDNLWPCFFMNNLEKNKILFLKIWLIINLMFFVHIFRFYPWVSRIMSSAHDGTVQRFPNMLKLEMHDGFVWDFRIIYRLQVLNWNHSVHELFSFSKIKST